MCIRPCHQSSKLCHGHHSTGSCTWQGDIATATKYAWDTVTRNTDCRQAKGWNTHSVSGIAPTGPSAAAAVSVAPCPVRHISAHLGPPIKEEVAVADVSALLLWWLDGQDQRHGGAGTGSSHAAGDTMRRKDFSTSCNEPLKIPRRCEGSREQPDTHLKILGLFSRHRIPATSVGAHWRIVGSLWELLTSCMSPCLPEIRSHSFRSAACFYLHVTYNLFMFPRSLLTRARPWEKPSESDLRFS